MSVATFAIALAQSRRQEGQCGSPSDHHSGGNPPASLEADFSEGPGLSCETVGCLSFKLLGSKTRESMGTSAGMIAPQRLASPIPIGGRPRRALMAPSVGS